MVFTSDSEFLKIFGVSRAGTVLMYMYIFFIINKINVAGINLVFFSFFFFFVRTGMFLNRKQQTNNMKSFPFFFFFVFFFFFGAVEIVYNIFIVSPKNCYNLYFRPSAGYTNKTKNRYY